MRISDWSSDVCSSDLVIDEAGSLAVNLQDLRQHSRADQDVVLSQLATQPRDWTTPLCVTLVRLDDEQTVLDLAAASSHFDLASPKWLAGSLLHDTATDLSDTLQYADYAEWRWSLVEDAPDPSGVSRSEVQKSEVHSPMRIPYVVF